jgi:hypothetical protein
VTTIAEKAAAPLRVSVRGRSGVGSTTVARALDRAGMGSGLRAAESEVVDVLDADLVVYVTTEVVKPEDSAAIAEARRPVLVVLNKADLAGFAGDGPIVAARDRCARFAALPELGGAPVEPMIGLLAVAAHDDLPDAVWTTLCAENGPVPTEARLRLLGTLDLFGTALAVAAVRKASTRAQLRALLRRVSCVDNVVAKLNTLGAQVRYRRVLDTVAALEALAVSAAGSADRLGERISEFLAHDKTVVARMAAAMEAIELADAELGPVEDGADPATHLSRAVHWQHYGLAGPDSDVHRACAADISRGSLRLWSPASDLKGLAELGEPR